MAQSGTGRGRAPYVEGLVPFIGVGLVQIPPPTPLLVPHFFPLGCSMHVYPLSWTWAEIVLVIAVVASG